MEQQIIVSDDIIIHHDCYCQSVTEEIQLEKIYVFDKLMSKCNTDWIQFYLATFPNIHSNVGTHHLSPEPHSIGTM